MSIDPKTVKAIDKAGERFVAFLKFRSIGPHAITQAQLKDLIRAGWITGTSVAAPVAEAYSRTHAKVADSPLPMSSRKGSLDFLERMMARYAEKAGGELKADVAGIVEATVMPFPDRGEGREVYGLLRDPKNWGRYLGEALHGRVENWRHRWDTIVRTELSRASNWGSVDAILHNNSDASPEDILVFKAGPNDDRTCEKCRTFWFDAAGSHPKVYRMSQLMANGTNIGRKAAEWKATVDPTHPRCFDDTTEVLTDSGWKLFKDATLEDRFFSYDPDSGKSGYVKAIGKVDQHYEGPMVSISNHRSDLLTTPNHQHFLRIKTTKWKDGVKAKHSYHALRGMEAFSGSWSLVGTLPEWKGDGSDRVRIGSSEFDMATFCEFMGYWLSEGYCYDQLNHTRIEIAQEKHIDPMRKCMAAMFGRHPEDVYAKHGKIVQYVPKGSDIATYLKRFGKSYEKFVPDEIKGSSKEFLRIFLDAYCLGDGSKRKSREWKGYDFGGETMYFTSSDQMAADLGEIILKVGRRPSYAKDEPKVHNHWNGQYLTNHPCWRISENKNGYSVKERLHIHEVPYSGRIHDVELEKWHVLVVRRNGKVALSGNCRHLLVQLRPGYGFDAKGNLEYRGKAYSHPVSEG